MQANGRLVRIRTCSCLRSDAAQPWMLSLLSLIQAAQWNEGMDAWESKKIQCHSYPRSNITRKKKEQERQNRIERTEKKREADRRSNEASQSIYLSVCQRACLLMFCHCFFRRETRKLTASVMFAMISSSAMFTLPTATAMHITFFSWNLIVAFVSSTACARKTSEERNNEWEAIDKRKKERQKNEMRQNITKVTGTKRKRKQRIQKERKKIKDGWAAKKPQV